MAVMSCNGCTAVRGANPNLKKKKKLTRKTLKSNSREGEREKSHCRDSSAWGCKRLKHYIMATSLTQNMLQSLDSMQSSIFMLERIWYHNFTWSGLNSQKIAIFVPIMGPRGLKLNRNKTTVKLCYMFPGKKIEDYMEWVPGNPFYACGLK